MKKLSVALLLALICSAGFGWDIVRQASFPTNFYCLEKIGDTFWAGGYVGGVAKSTDDGLTWTFVPTPAYTPPTYKDVWDIDFIDQNNGIMVGDDGMVVLTTDGGVTWNWPASVQAVVGTTRMYGAVYFPDGRIWIAGYDGLIAYSPDFGASWSQQGSGVTSDIIYSISMNDAGVGFCAMNNGTPDQSKILATTDFGNSWTLVNLTVAGNPTMYKVRHFGSKVVLLGDKGYLGYSNDNGATWTHYPNAAGTLTSDAMRDVIMVGDTGYAVGRNARLLKTTDGWATYTMLTHNFNPYFEGIKLRNDGSLLACGWQGTISVCYDGGYTWEDLFPTAIDLWQASIVDADTWYVVGDKGSILKTTDGGQTLEKKGIPGSVDLYYACYFKNALEGWVSGKTTGKIYRTVDGGENWSTFTVPGFAATKSYRDFFFLNENVGYLLGAGGMVTKTTDGGITWTSLGDNINTAHSLFCTYWKSELNGYAGSGSGLLYITTNGGTTWTSITVGGSANIRDIWFRTPDNGVMVKENGEIWYTLTGGNTAGSWIAATEGAVSQVTGVYCDHNGVYWADGYSNEPSQQGNTWSLMKSLDYGATWSEETFPPLSFNATRFSSITAGGGKIVAIGKNNLIVAQLEVPEHVTLNSPLDFSTGLDPASVMLSWTPSPYGSQAAFYQVFASTSRETLFDNLYFETTSTTFELGANADLGYDTTWYWAVLPVNEILDSPDPDSPNFMVWRFTTMPGGTLEPPEVSIEEGLGQVRVFWNAVPNATYYRVWGATDPYGAYAELQTVTATEYIHPNPGPMKFFKVLAGND
jgi:photosystem II stability/assembly factor-like uncharacterized protein